MDTILLALQARLLLAVGLGWLGIGLWMGHDPLTVAWRAAVGAAAVMWIGGVLLRQVAGVIEERAAADLAERQLKAEQEAAKQLAVGRPASPVAPAPKPR